MLEEGKNCQYIFFKVILTKNLRSKVGPHIATAFAVPEHGDQQDQRDGGDTKIALQRGLHLLPWPRHSGTHCCGKQH